MLVLYTGPTGPLQCLQKSVEIAIDIRVHLDGPKPEKEEVERVLRSFFTASQHLEAVLAGDATKLYLDSATYQKLHSSPFKGDLLQAVKKLEDKATGLLGSGTLDKPKYHRFLRIQDLAQKVLLKLEEVKKNRIKETEKAVQKELGAIETSVQALQGNKAIKLICEDLAALPGKLQAIKQKAQKAWKGPELIGPFEKSSISFRIEKSIKAVAQKDKEIEAFTQRNKLKGFQSLFTKGIKELEKSCHELSVSFQAHSSQGLKHALHTLEELQLQLKELLHEVEENANYQKITQAQIDIFFRRTA